MKRKLLSTLGCLYALSLASSALADDWPQFRHDAAHSAASKDPLQFPLKEVWTWNKERPAGQTPLYHAVVWHDNVYFTGLDGQQRCLICADAASGAVRWRKPLSAARLPFVISEIAGPAVSENGTVFVYDWMTERATGSKEEQELTERLRGIYYADGLPFKSIQSFAVRAFDAKSGKEVDRFPLSAMGANGVLRRLSLLEGLKPQEVRPVPATFVGCPP